MHVRGTDGLLEAGHMVMGDGSRFESIEGLLASQKWRDGK